MPTTASRFRTLPAVLLAIAGLGFATSAWAQERANYTISDNEGYGIADCMRSGSACGREMADSWCQAHGHARALSFGSSDDVTGSVPVVEASAKPNPGDVVISCGD
jgi:hypothetical protein